MSTVFGLYNAANDGDVGDIHISEEEEQQPLISKDKKSTKKLAEEWDAVKVCNGKVMCLLDFSDSEFDDLSD